MIIMLNHADKVQYILDNLEELDGWDSPADTYLQSFWSIPDEISRAALAAEKYDPAMIYYHAAVDVRDKLLSRYDAANDPRMQALILECLVMQGDEVVATTFGPNNVTYEAGWVVDSDGQSRELVFDTAYAVSPGPGMMVGIPCDERCGTCGSELTRLFLFDGTDPRLRHVKIDHTIFVMACMNCLFYVEALYTRFTACGDAELIQPYRTMYVDTAQMVSTEEDKAHHKKFCDELSRVELQLSEQPVPPFSASCPWSGSTVGGFPGWIQYPQYPTCPDCGRDMMFFAQLQWDILIDWMDGTLYVHLCPSCGVSSVLHQQS